MFDRANFNLHFFGIMKYISLESFKSACLDEYHFFTKSFYIFWRWPVFRIKSTLNCLMVLSAIMGLVFVIGCSASNDKHEITDFLQDYSKTFDEYADALKKADTAKKMKSKGN